MTLDDWRKTIDEMPLPRDPQVLLVYSDWLEEMGDMAEAERQREMADNWAEVVKASRRPLGKVRDLPGSPAHYCWAHEVFTSFPLHSRVLTEVFKHLPKDADGDRAHHSNWMAYTTELEAYLALFEAWAKLSRKVQKSSAYQPTSADDGEV
jgi:hypothetical protein